MTSASDPTMGPIADAALRHHVGPAAVGDLLSAVAEELAAGALVVTAHRRRGHVAEARDWGRAASLVRGIQARWNDGEGAQPQSPIAPTQPTKPPTEAETEEVAVTDPSPDPFGDPRRAPAAVFVNPAIVPWGTLAPAMAELDVDDRISFSRMSTLANCSLQHALGRLSRQPDSVVPSPRPGWANIGGRAFHRAVEGVERDHLVWGRLETPTQDEWESLLLQELGADVAGTPWTIHDVRTSARGKEGFDWWRIEGHAMVAQYVRFHDAAYRATHIVAHLHGSPALEWGWSLAVTEDLTATGYIDAIWWEPATSPRLTVVDYKTGSYPSNPVQLALYCHAVREALGPAARLPDARVWDARKGAYTEATSPGELYGAPEIRHRLRVAKEIERQGLYLPNPSFLCSACGHGDVCPSRGSF